MKRSIVRISTAALLALAVSGLFASCDPEETQNENETVEVTEASLQGTWQGEVEKDMAQGYFQKYRVSFSGKNYTLWHAYQELIKADGEFSLETVGDKEKGTWEYADGKLTFTPKEQFASHFISNLSPMEYTIYAYSPETMEAETWYETPSAFVETAEPKVWSVSLTKTALTVKIRMDTFVLEKVN